MSWAVIYTVPGYPDQVVASGLESRENALYEARVQSGEREDGVGEFRCVDSLTIGEGFEAASEMTMRNRNHSPAAKCGYLGAMPESSTGFTLDGGTVAFGGKQ